MCGSRFGSSWDYVRIFPLIIKSFEEEYLAVQIARKEILDFDMVNDRQCDLDMEVMGVDEPLDLGLATK